MNDARAFLDSLDRFHITDRSLLRARAAAHAGDQLAIAQLCRQARRYFASMHEEAGRQLADIDRKLDDLYQRQYNLQAERGVVQRRQRGSQEVLDAISKMESQRVDS
ncbi:MAG: hypothetical protein M3T49_01560 [Candidatus Eremiobacteraeota bacterium]|nr:hypothetical protein [Candidatus Eremiobacteraeota bacterium]